MAVIRAKAALIARSIAEGGTAYILEPEILTGSIGSRKTKQLPALSPVNAGADYWCFLLVPGPKFEHGSIGSGSGVKGPLCGLGMVWHWWQRTPS